MSKRATKSQINKAIRESVDYGKFKVFAQGTTQSKTYTARARLEMGTVTRTRTVMTRNGRFRVTVWGSALAGGARPEVVREMANGLVKRGFVVENLDQYGFEVHNGTIYKLDGVLRWEGTY